MNATARLRLAVHSAQRGVAAVEFAIILTVLVPLLFGTSEFGRAIFQFDALTKSVDSGARYLATQAPGDPTAIASATCMVVYGNTACTGNALVQGLTTQMVSVCDRTSCASANLVTTGQGVINTVTVTISNFQFVSLASGVFPSVTFNPISATFEQVM
jgi:Flp pilus assembly protein TadG